MRRGVFVVLSVLAALIVVVGCGGGDDGSQTTAEPLTKAEFISKANSICEKNFAKKVAAVDASIKKLEREEDFTKASQEKIVTEDALPPISQMTEELATLGVPAGSGKAGELVPTLKRILKEVEAKPALLLSTTDPFLPAEELSEAYGIEECGEI